MCVVERKTYIHSDGRRDVVEKQRRCHNAPRNGLCSYVEHKNIDVARVVEMKPSLSHRSPADELITTGRDGRSQRYQTLSRRNSAKNPSGRTSRAGERSPADSMSPPAPLQPTYKEIRPPAPTPPIMPTSYPSARRSETLPPTFPPDPNVTIGLGGTAVYERPPSLEMPRADINERPYLARPSSFSSTSAEIDDPEPPSPPRRRVSFRERKPSNVMIDVEAASGLRASPGLSNPPNPFADAISRDNVNSRSRADSAANEVRRQQQQQEDERQARLENGKLAEAERRQRARIRRASEAAEEARQRAAYMERERAESSRERKDRERRKNAATPEGEQQARRDAEMDRKIQAELAQFERERAQAEARREQQYQPIRPSTSSMSPRNSYTTYPITSSPTSARTQTTISARGPTYPVMVHNPPARKNSNSISERGEQVIAREQARAVAERMKGMQLSDDVIDEDDDLDAPLDAGMRRTASRRLRKEGKDREREQKRERERRLRDGGFF